MTSYLRRLLETFSKWSPIRVEGPLVNIENLTIGDKTYKVENSEIILEKGNRIKIAKDDKGNLQLLYNNTQLSGFLEDKHENIKLLDEEKKVFTRADISELQLGFLSIEEKHKQIIKKLRPILLGYRNNWDLASLLIASRIIVLEDKKISEELIKQYSAKLKTSYKKIGRMIYNLFRSGILESEIIFHLEKLERIYPTIEDARKNFLIYWYSIIHNGYPTAYFVQFWDSDITIFKEIRWRFDRGSSYVDVYSRGEERNKLTKRWCESFAKEENCLLEDKTYQLGFTPAMKFRIVKKD